MAMSLIAAAPAAAQYSSSANSADQSTAGTLRLQAGTTQQGCSGRTTQVGSWIQGHTSVWPPETFDSQGNCFVQSGGGNAVVTIFAQGCGAWSGKSNHRYVQGGATTDIELNRTTTLFAGGCEPPPPDCSQYGPDYYWNGYECTNIASPIIISTRHGAAYKLTSVADGVLFDLNADGIPEQTAWTAADADIAFLALDQDGDGQITSGRELFGNNTVPGAMNGFDALALMAMEANGGVMRGSVSSIDPLFERLLLWIDRNHDGVSQPSELRPAKEFLSDIGLGYDVSKRRDQFGNRFLFKGWVHLRTRQGRNEAKSQEENDERTRPVWDVYFAVQR